MIRRPPRSTLFPTRRSSDLDGVDVRLLLQREVDGARAALARVEPRRVHDVFDAVEDARDLIQPDRTADRKSTRLNSSHVRISYAVFCLKKKKTRSDERYGAS